MFQYEFGSRGHAPEFGTRGTGLFRFARYLPVTGVPAGYADDVGDTAVLAAPALGDALGVELFLKNEATNPSGSFKDRGLAVAIALGRALGAVRVCLPTQGNAGVAAAMFSARLRARCTVYMPRHYEGGVYHRAAAFFGAEVHFFGANIAEAGQEMRRALASELAAGESLDVSTFFEPGRLEGKKTMGLEICEHFGARLPDWIIYPTGGGTGLVGIWKAFAELGITERPRMVAVQSTGCAPVVQAFARGLDHVERVQSKGTIADGLDVPGAIMGHRILSTLRESNGTAIAVDDGDIRRAFDDLGAAGIGAGHESAATLAALRALVAAGTIPRGDRVLSLLTGTHLIPVAHGLQRTS